MSEPLSRQGGEFQDLSNAQAVQRIFVPILSRGMSGKFMPERQMLPSQPELPFWRDMSGFEIHDGALTPAGMVSDGDEIGLPTLNKIQQFGIDYQGGVIVTSEEIWKNTPTGWKSLTPQYTEGDCSVAQGSDKVFLSGSASWTGRGHIQAGQIIDPGDAGVWYEIASVDGSKSLTLTEVYAGTTLTDADYTIRHNFRCTGGMVQSTIFNNDLIVCFASNQGDEISAICQVENVFRDDPPIARFLVGNVQFFDTEALNGNVDVLEEVDHFMDVEVHSDGRVLAAARITDVDEGGRAGNRMYYSSPVDRYQWDLEPGGFVDVVGVAGDIGAIHRFGEQTVIHFDSGIQIGFESGLSEPPLNLEVNPSVVRGATHPRTVKNTPIGQIYASLDGSESSPQVFVFDGSVSKPIGDPIRDFIKENVSFETGANLRGLVWAYINERTHAYHLFFAEAVSLQARTWEFVYHWDIEQWTQTIREENLYGFGSSGSSNSTLGKLVSTNADSGTLDKWVHVLTNDESLCTVGGGFLHSAGRYLRSEWLDGKRPGYDKTWTQVLLWIDTQTNPITALPISCQLVARDTSVTSPRATTAETVTVTSTPGDQKILQFSFAPFVAEAVQIRLVFDTANAGLTIPIVHHMAIDFMLLGQTEASGGTTQ